MIAIASRHQLCVRATVRDDGGRISVCGKDAQRRPVHENRLRDARGLSLRRPCRMKYLSCLGHLALARRRDVTAGPAPA